jgi:hypothetical protein
MDVRNGPDDGLEPGRDAEPGDDVVASPPAEVTGAMTVEVDGTSRRLPVEHDYTGDGRPDAAVETPDGTVIVFADTEDNETGAPGPDGRADEAYVVDKRTGRVLGTAHLDPGSGSWVSADGEPVQVPAAETSRRVEQAPPTPVADSAQSGGAEEARAD